MGSKKLYRLIISLFILLTSISCKQSQTGKTENNFSAFIVGSQTYYNTSSTTIKIQFSEKIARIDINDIKILKGNATVSNLKKLSDTLYQFDLNFLSQGTVRLRLEEGNVLNEYNEIAKRSKIVEYIYDNDSPVAVLSAKYSSYNLSNFKVDVSFNESISDLSIQDFVTSNSGIQSLTKISDQKYELTLNAYSEGYVAVQLLSNAVYDKAKNYNVTSNIATTNYCMKCLVLGQDDYDSVDLKKGLKFALHGAKASFVYNNKLIVADTKNNRVLIWNTVPKTSLNTPDIVLGQKSLDGSAINAGGAVNSSSLHGPRAVYYDGVKLYVSDTQNNRILIWNSLPTQNNKSADIVLGQSSFNSYNSGLANSKFNRPEGIHISGTKLYIADTKNNRVLVWNTIPTNSNRSADLVIGQINFTTNTANAGGLNASSLNSPTSITSDGTKILIADSQNNRVLIWNTTPAINYSSANIVIGQNVFTSMNKNNGGLSAASLDTPYSVYSINGKLYIADSGNKRVLIWNTLPSTNFSSANLVIGQVNKTTDTYDNTSLDKTKFEAKSHIGGDSQSLFVPDPSNNRMLAWTVIPHTDNFPAQLYFGQYTFQDRTPNIGTAADNVFINPKDIFYDGQRFFLADSTNHRVLIWNNFPSTINQTPDVVLGQPDMSSSIRNHNNLSDKSLNYPTGIYSDGVKLYVADQGNNRILIWNSIPLTNYIKADIVLGQPDFTSNTANNGGLGAKTLSSPTAIIRIYNKLIVTDTGNNRVLVWNSLPTINNKEANFVIGQTNMLQNTANQGGVMANSLNSPSSLATDGIKLIIGDTKNNRVLIWNSVPVNNGVNANNVIGQSNFTQSFEYSGGITNKSLGQINSVHCSATKKLFISTDARVLQWNEVPTTDFAPSNQVYVQADFASITPNKNGLSYKTISVKNKLSSTNDVLVISDQENSRVLMRPLK